MKFVHLAPRTSLERIRRHGLRGTPGRGVYCVPFAMTSQSRYDDDGELIERIERRSLVGLWKWWLKRRRVLAPYGLTPNRRPVAILFDLPPRAWPLTVRMTDVETSVADEAALWRAYDAAFAQGGPQSTWECDFDVCVPVPVPARFLHAVWSLDRPLGRRPERRAEPDCTDTDE